MPQSDTLSPICHGQVAEALGHGSDAITRKRYISAEVLDRARFTRVTEALESKPELPDPIS